MSKEEKEKKERKKGGCLKKSIGGLLILIAIIWFATDGSKGAQSAGDGEGAKQTVYEVGQPFETEGLEITITKYETRKEVGNEFINETASEGAVLVCVQYKFTNISNEPISISPTVKLVDNEEVEYNQDFGKTVAYSSEVEDYDEKVLSDLNPGLTSRSVNVYEVSEPLWNEKSWRLKITAGLFGGDAYYVRLKE